MDYSTDTDESTIDLSKYSTKDSCLWLLSRLRTHEHYDDPYTLPFSAYVMSWHKAVPITCIIMAQNPYPQNVYSPIAAAMSYDTELAELQVKRRIYKVPIPPTVEIFANDMYINAGMKKQDMVNILKNGWSLVEYGVLLVNEGVFTKSSDPEYYDESSNQCNVIIRLLQETEKYDNRTVDVYGLGEAGQRMASNLCSWYKSSTVRLSKHTAKHPAALSRRFRNFNHPDCHLDTPSFSKSLAKHLSNYVAYAYTMAKKNADALMLQRYADIIRSSSEQFSEVEKAQTVFNQIVKEAMNMDYTDVEKVKEMFERLYGAGDNLAFREGITASTLSNVQKMGENISGHVAKPGPSLQNPSTASIDRSMGQANRTTEPTGMKAKKLNLTKSKPSVAPSETLSFTNVSPPPSVTSIKSTNTPRKLNLTKSKSANSTPVKPVESETPSKSVMSDNTVESVTSPPIEVEENRKTKSSLGARFRKMNLTADSANSEPSGQQEKSYQRGGPLEITKEQRNQLSCVEAVVMAHRDDAVDDPDCVENFELIQNDIQQGVKYNSITERLVEAIDGDIKSIPKFNFVDWASTPNKSSATFELCKELFNF